MDEIIGGIQVIKMYAWERPFSQLINLARKLELKEVRMNSYLRGIYMTFLLFTTRMALFCTMMTMALTDQEITAAKIFVVSAFFNILSQTMSQMFVRGVAEIAEVMVAFRRLRAFLVYEEKGAEGRSSSGLTVELGEKQEKPKVATEFPDDSVMIVARNVTARWSNPDEVKLRKEAEGKKLIPEPFNHFKSPTLSSLNFKCEKGSLIGVVGAVGAGKSSLLQAILRELPLESGEMTVNGSVSYACQEPWVFAASIRQNILFGLDYEKAHYDNVVRACCLIPDFEQFPDGDQTIIGERGSSLSGGQKARVSLARAMYRTSDIYLLDDPLSAVDAHVGKHLFDECIGPRNRLCRRQTRVLVTHQVHFLKEADWMIVLKDGAIELQGRPNDLFREAKDMEQYFSVLGEEDQADLGETSDSIGTSRKSSEKSSRRSSVSVAKVALKASEEKQEHMSAHMNLEQTSKDQVKGSLFLQYLKSGGSFCTVFFLFCLFLLTQIIASLFDWFVSFWTRQEELRVLQSQSNATAERAVDLENIGPVLSTESCLYIHGGLIIALFIVGMSRAFAFYSVCMKSSANLHSQMFSSIVSTKMRFFDTNPSGRILNRFSKDMGAVDEYLPKVILDSVQMVLSLVGVVIVAIIVDYLFLIPVAALAFAFMFVRKIYLKSSKNIKRLDGISKSGWASSSRSI